MERTLPTDAVFLFVRKEGALFNRVPDHGIRVTRGEVNPNPETHPARYVYRLGVLACGGGKASWSA